MLKIGKVPGRGKVTCPGVTPLGSDASMLFLKSDGQATVEALLVTRNFWQKPFSTRDYLLDSCF